MLWGALLKATQETQFMFEPLDRKGAFCPLAQTQKHSVMPVTTLTTLTYFHCNKSKE